ncbi:MAG: hypothetical protein AAF721_23205 [Myxococcota bacterium]
MKGSAAWLGRSSLVAAIRWYRRRVSGRGPLRGVVCSFAESESCSAYGLRMVQQRAGSLPGALRLIARRLARCRDASVYCDRRALLWGPDYDELRGVDARASRAHEAPATRVALLRAAVALARYRGHRSLHRLRTQLRALAARVPKSTARLPLRDGRRLSAYLRGRWHRALIALAAPLLVALFLPGLAQLAVVGVVVALAAVATYRWHVADARFARQRRLARFALA